VDRAAGCAQHRGGINIYTSIIHYVGVKRNTFIAYFSRFVYNHGMETSFDMPRRPKDTPPPRPLKEIREGKHWSVATLSRLAGVDPVTIWRIETGRTAPHPSTVRAISKALDLHPSAVSEFAAEVRK
jgi:DNA-binding XRE family transcriptional regulator